MDTAQDPRDELCGLFSWRPRCMQKLAHHRVFAASYVIIGVVQGMIYAYFNGVLTTMEKAFGIPSRSMGFILSGNDISQLLCGVLITYVAGRGSRPAWLAAGMLITAASCFMYATAQLLWDGSISISNKASSHQAHALCHMDPEEHTLSNHSVMAQSCDGYSSNVPVMAIFFIGQFISGMGSATIFTLGLTYMDDSVKKSASPLYLAITGALRSLGPTLGYIMASVFLNIYIDPQTKPEYSRQDPRWLGAWWLGFVIIGAIQMVITFPMLLFPKKLPTRYRNKSVNSDNKMEIEQEIKLEAPSFHDFLATMRRILHNPLVILHVFSIGPLFLGLIGFSTFLPKYLEANFGQTSSQSSLSSGTAGTMMIMVGVFVGGLIIWKFKPRALYICIASGVVDFLFAIGMFVIMNFKCDNGAFVGVDFNDGSILMTSNCSQNCACGINFDPVCLGSQNYLSPCSAGCSAIGSGLGDKTVFKNCACAPNHFDGILNSTFDEQRQTAQMGYCPGSRSNCDYFWPYISILAALKFMVAGTRTGGILVFMRSMEQRDKSIGMALSANAMSLLGFIPGPIVFGAVADSACQIWETTSCGQRGNCWLYNMDELRVWYHGVTIACLIIAGIFEFALSIYARKLNLYSDDPPSKLMSFREGLGWRPKFQTQASVASGLEIIKAQH